MRLSLEKEKTNCLQVMKKFEYNLANITIVIILKNSTVPTVVVIRPSFLAFTFHSVDGMH
jgi:hypothetical protein